ncbi:MAG: glycosyltransferase family 2 protein [Chloroflexi bacterium]|nr:glycosyltransferase family 2 protein [Chloroflexota bacterium]
MMNTKLKLTILMPCLNEAETLTTCIRKARSFIESSGVAGEILVADNGSSDGSDRIARKAGARVVAVEGKGYGNALLGGIRASAGEFIIMGDADDSYDFSQLHPFLQALESGADLVMGNRFRGGIKPGAMPLLHRYLGNPVLSALGRLFFGGNIGDFHSGLRGFRRDAILSLDLQTTGMEFASEMVVKASIRKLKITEVPTILYPDGRSRPPHLRTWSDGWRHLRFLLMYSPRWLFFYPGLALIAIGLAGSIFLLPGPQQIGRITFDINTLLYASLLVLLGLQAVLFSIFSKVFAIGAGLLPDDADTRIFLEHASLERGLLAGALMIALGLASSIGAVIYWSRNAFGPIDPGHSMRLVIPGIVLFASGFQVVFSSFFLGILTTRRKKHGG